MNHRKGSERSPREALAELHGSLDRRYRPEDVAELVLQALAGRPTGRERNLLARAARHSSRGWFTSLPDDFARPVGGARQVAVAARLFGVRADVDPDDPESLRAYAGTAGRMIGWRPGRRPTTRPAPDDSPAWPPWAHWSCSTRPARVRRCG